MFNNVENYLVFRERDHEPGTWTLVADSPVYANHRATLEECSELCVRSYLSKSKNVGGTFAVVRKRDWDRVKGTKPSPVAKREAA